MRETKILLSSCTKFDREKYYLYQIYCNKNILMLFFFVFVDTEKNQTCIKHLLGIRFENKKEIINIRRKKYHKG